jgi:DNA polymerase-3 subunit alpha
LDNFRFEMENFCPNTIAQLKDLEKYKDRDLIVGGMVTAVNHRVSKNGKPFGNFTIEDFNDSFELVLFGQDYVSFRKYMEPGYFIRVCGKSQERFHQPGSIEFKVVDIQLLPDLREKMLRNITIHVQLNELSETFVDRLLEVVKENSKSNHPHCDLHLNVTDPESNMSVKLPSRKFRINPDNQFLELIHNMPGVAEVKYNEN